MSSVVLGRPYLPNSLLLIRQLPWMLVARHAPVVAVIVFEGIGFFAVNGIVADLTHLVGHAEGHAADEFYEHHDQGGPDDVPADDEKCADNLETDLAAVACNGTAGVSDAESLAAFYCCPET